ncbi:MAG: cytochrome c-type biosis protein CcmE [Thermoleophilaceae bacterium]|jgi:cytochrome c-type biogenesis protein CcmE|nr:cytochrome c-type biosis protein CcmE [Thermoleophilaceae bacterium]
MDPRKKKRIRLVVALTAAIFLAGALLYTSFGSATAAKEPSQVLAARNGDRYELVGKVVNGSIQRHGDTLSFKVEDRKGGGASLPVTYSGVVSDTFRDGREIIVKGRLENGTFQGERDTLTTKCPSKFKKKPGSSV